MQNRTHYVGLWAPTGIPLRRCAAIIRGNAVSRAEIEALARAWPMSAGDLIASIDGRSKMEE